MLGSQSFGRPTSENEDDLEALLGVLLDLVRVEVERRQTVSAIVDKDRAPEDGAAR